MRILSITAGAAGMYCGSCFRDNALAAELKARGHDVVLMPLYTPTLTDEPNVSAPRVFFGGISVYLEQHVPLFRRTPWVLDRLWDSTLVLKAAARRSIRTEPRMLGELTVSILKGEHGNQRKEIEKLLRWLEDEPPFDVISLSYTLLLGLAGPLGRALGRPICCALQGEDLFLDGLAEPYRGEALALIKGNLEHVDAFMAVSEYYASFMQRYLQIPEASMRLVPLGISTDGYGPAPRPQDAAFTIGYFARVAPEKGLHVLCEAYRRLRQQESGRATRLEVAGYLGPDHTGYLAGIERQMTEWGLGGEFHYRGAPDRAGKVAFLRSLDVLSVPAPYAEPKGTFLLEAMANGVPVVQPRRGAFVEIVRKTGGGLLVEPDDPDRLAEGLLALWRDPARRAELARNGVAGVRRHYHVSRMADAALAVYEEVIGAGASRPPGHSTV